MSGGKGLTRRALRDLHRYYDLSTTNYRYGNVKAVNPVQGLFRVGRGNNHWIEAPRMEAMFWYKIGYRVWSDWFNAFQDFDARGNSSNV